MPVINLRRFSFLLLQLLWLGGASLKKQDYSSLRDSPRTVTSPKLDALKKMTQTVLATVQELEEELSAIEENGARQPELDEETPPPDEEGLSVPQLQHSLLVIREEYRAQVTRFRPLRHLDRKLIEHTPAWRARGLEDVPRKFDESFSPAHCFWRKEGSATELACLPSFFILGTPKSGTTALWYAE